MFDHFVNRQQRRLGVNCRGAQDEIERLTNLLARAYPFLTWPDNIRGAGPALDAEFDAIVRDVEVAIQHLPDDKEH